MSSRRKEKSNNVARRDSRVEYFRGKDFASLLSTHSGLLDILTSSNVNLESPVEKAVAEMMLERELIVRCDRVKKTIRPGKTKLSKWPAKLVMHPKQTFTENEGFYAWNFESKKPLWETILSILLPFFTVACCLFPVFPYWAKLSVLYTSLSLLCVMMGIIIVRAIVFGIIWVLTGKTYWFFPNILRDEVASLKELLRFLPYKDEDPPAKLLTRLVLALFATGIVVLAVKNTPDEDARAHLRKKVVNIIDDVVAWSPAMLGSNNATAEKDPAEPLVPSPPEVELNETAKIEQIFAKAADLASDLGEEAEDLEIEKEKEERVEKVEGEV